MIFYDSCRTSVFIDGQVLPLVSVILLQGMLSIHGKQNEKNYHESYEKEEADDLKMSPFPL